MLRVQAGSGCFSFGDTCNSMGGWKKARREGGSIERGHGSRFHQEQEFTSSYGKNTSSRGYASLLLPVIIGMSLSIKRPHIMAVGRCGRNGVRGKCSASGVSQGTGCRGEGLLADRNIIWTIGKQVRPRNNVSDAGAGSRLRD